MSEERDEGGAEKPEAEAPDTGVGEAKAVAVVETPLAAQVPGKMAWGAPLHRLDKAWTKLDARLCAFVLVAEVLTLFFWVSIVALASTGRGGPGLVYRQLVTAAVCGGIGYAIAKGRMARPDIAGTAAVVVGFFLGYAWGDHGAAYFANFLAWMQNASILVFFGGVSDIAKRLTLWLALLGASIATGQGKHITVDVVMRFLTPRARVPVAVLGWLVAAAVSLFAAWGFFDNLAVEEFRAPASVACADDPAKMCPAPPMSKVEKVAEDTRRNLFLAGRQLSLDVRTFPRVLVGTNYRSWLTPAEWNAWLRDGGWEKHFDAESVRALQLPEDGSVETRTPAVTSIPGASEQVARVLVGLLNMVFPFGLLVIALRFVLRSLLAISGWVNVDPDAAHADDELAHVHDPNDVAVAAAHTDTTEVAR